MSDEEKEQLQTNIKCIDCKEVIRIDTNNMVYCEEFNFENGEKIFLTYFDCPSCGKRHFLQIDNLSTKTLLKECQLLMIRLSNQKLSGKKPNKKMVDKFTKKRRRLMVSRSNLIINNEGKVVIDKNNSRYDLHFTITNTVEYTE